MTDKIGIDEQYPNLSALAQGRVSGSFSEWPQLKTEAAAILRNYKHIMEAKVPEPVAYLQTVSNPGEPDRQLLSITCDRSLHRQLQTGGTYTRKPLYGPEVLDLLRRETAKNERIKELLREPSAARAECQRLRKDAEQAAKERDYLVSEYERAVKCGKQGYLHAALHIYNAITNAALLAEVEKE
jgi:hypothetical protein